MADHSKPTTTSSYANFVAELDGRLKDLASGLDPTVVSPSAVPTGAVRWNGTANTWQRWNGTSWTALSSMYALPGLTVSGNVGIGTATPSTKLAFGIVDIVGEIGRIGWDVAGAQRAYISAVRHTATGQLTDLVLGTMGADRLRIDSGGNTRPGTDNASGLGAATNRWSVVYAGTGSINTSDESEKQDIGDVPDQWLDAWADVQWARFRFRDAVASKGAAARWHVGLIAQRVEAAFAARGLDAREIGLLCWDCWTDDAGAEHERYGIRYEEALALESALMRRTVRQLEQRLAASA